jgi:hypothetical protein
MKIEDLLVQSQIDEGVGSAIGRGIGAVSRGIGAVASVPQGIGRAIKKGYQGGVDTIAGDAAPNTAGPAGATAQRTVPQTTQQPQGAVSTSLGNLGNSLANITGAGGNNTNNAQAATPGGTNATATGNTAGGANVSLLQDKKFMGSLQALKGGDVEKVRAVLKSRAAVAEDLDEGWRDSLSTAGHVISSTGKYVGQNALAGAKYVGNKAVQGAKYVGNKGIQGAKYVGNKAVQGVNAAGQAIANSPDTLGTVAGKIGGAGTRFSQAYQNARGGYMTMQDLQRSIATMSPKDAGEALQFFNSIHPEAPAAAPAAGTGGLNVVDGGRAVAQEGIDELADIKNMLSILKTR